MALTDTFLRQVKPNGAPNGEKHADGGGMYLHVKATGKYWRMDYRFVDKKKTLALGVYPDVSLAKARDRRKEARELLADGVDPAGVLSKAAVNRMNVEANANSFEKLALEWLAGKVAKGWAPKTESKTRAHLSTHLFPHLGARPIAGIKASEILAVLKIAVDSGIPYTATRLREVCGQIFRLAIRKDLMLSNPVDALLGEIQAPPTTHHPALTTRREFAEFLIDLKNQPTGSVVTLLATRLALLTFVRPKEFRLALWNEIDLEAKEWKIAAGRMKKDKAGPAFTVPLSAQAIEVIEQLRLLHDGGVYLFPNIHQQGKVISENTIAKLLWRMGYKGRQTHHGFRGSARSLLSERGWTVAALERQLDHKEANKTIAAYARSQHLEERRKLMDDWGSLVVTLEASDNVIPLRTAA